MKKVIELYDAKATRHCNMLVGETGGGKSVCWTTLQRVKTKLAKKGVPGFEKAFAYVINPKVLSLDELYGAYNLETREWTDGEWPPL